MHWTCPKGFHHNDYVAYLSIYAPGGGEDSENGILWIKHEYIDSMLWSDLTDPESQSKKTKEQIAREKAGRLAKVKNILAASTRQDWEANGTRLWVRKGDTELRIVDLTDDEGRVELDEEWARSAAGRARLPSGWSSRSATARSCWRRSPRFA